MSNFLNRLKEVMSLNVLVFGILILVGIIVLTIAIRSLRINKTKKELESLELKYSELKAIPLSFKLNKAVALSKVNRTIENDINEYEKEYDEAQELLKEYNVVLAEIDDYIFSKKLKKANASIDSVVEVVSKSETAINTLSEKLDLVLEQENTQRENINSLKSGFRNAKRRFMENRADYHQSVEYLDGKITDIEDMFSVFEEWMFASEFNKASDKQNEISKEVELLEQELDLLPNYYQQSKVILVGALEELQYMASSAKAQGAYLDHLEVDKQIDVLREIISEMLSKLSVGKIANIADDIDDCETRIVQLKEQIEAETSAYAIIHDKVSILFDKVRGLNQTIQKIKELYERVNQRFGFDNLNKNLTSLEEELDTLNEQRYRLEKVISENSVPYSTLLLSYEELELDVQKLDVSSIDMLERLENACSDEERAKQQLVKLQLLTNEMRAKIAKHRLPSVSEKFDDDLIKANASIIEIRDILNVTPLQVDTLNAKLKEGIDFVYSLYNSVNNLVGMAVMVENAIVFGNKYRSEYVEVDSELTRAELCFNNGQYTKSLKIAMTIIEKLHPGAYENLVTKSTTFEEVLNG